MRTKLILLIFCWLSLSSCTAPSGVVTDVTAQCISVVKSFPSSVRASGKLVMDGSQSYLLDLSTQTKQRIPLNLLGIKDIVSNIKISPDGAKFVFLESHYDEQGGSFLDDHLELVQGGVQQEITSWRADFGTLLRWFGNNWLLFAPENSSNGTILLFNPVDGTTKKVIGTFPNMATLPPLPAWYQGSDPLPIYDASLSLAVYLGQEQEMQFVLWDVKSKTALWKKSISDPGIQPQWSPVGDGFVFAVPNSHVFDFYHVDRGGHEDQLTNLGVSYQFVYMGAFNWSPDGKKIAFWLDLHNDPSAFHPTLAVFDLDQREIIDTCLGIGGRTPVWSPDGKQIAVEIQPTDSSQTVALVVDLASRSAVQLDEQVHPLGWIK